MNQTSLIPVESKHSQTTDSYSRDKHESSFFRKIIQTKLVVNSPNDVYEQEADAIADKVMRMPDPSINDNLFFKPSVAAIQRKCADCEEEEEKIQRRETNSEITDTKQKIFVQEHGESQTEVPQAQRKFGACADKEIYRMMADEEEEESVQRKTADANEIDPNLESGLSNLGGGQPLSKSARSFFEPRFGQSFSDVRIHTGADANRAAKSINARAYTLGNNIAFASGEYNSSSASGRGLIAHELTHTLQQAAGAKSVQRGGAGILGGKCCLRAPRVEWALVGAGVWKKLEEGQCTGTMEDADGMTCGGGFYHVDNGQTGSCSSPRNDDATFAPRRWTPSSAGASASSPTAEGSTGGDTPPNYVYDAATTAACPNGIRTISVDFVTLNGATTSAATELASANRIYSSCCVQFVAGATPATESLATTQSWLGGDTDVNASGITCATPTAEERTMYDQATSAHSLSSRMRVFLVNTFSGYGTAAGFSRPPYCSGGYVNHVILSNAVSSTTNPLAHEFGHILLDNGNHTTSPNLMAPSGGTTLSPADCTTIYGNA